jgi:hypothetical protein
MLDLQIVFPVIISICVGLAYLAINHFKTFIIIGKLINIYTYISIGFYIIYSLFIYKVKLESFKNVVDYLLESFVILIPKLFYIFFEIVGKTMEKDKL